MKRYQDRLVSYHLQERLREWKAYRVPWFVEVVIEKQLIGPLEPVIPGHLGWVLHEMTTE